MSGQQKTKESIREPVLAYFGKISSVIATSGQGTGRSEELTYMDLNEIGYGSFGVVSKAQICCTGELVAIKKVQEDPRYKSRELDIMRKLHHHNIVQLRYFFYSYDEKGSLFLNLVLEYVPETLYSVARYYRKRKQHLPLTYIKAYIYQLFKSLEYMHSLGICHRDIKPQNLLVYPDTKVLKVCDFGSAKKLVEGEPNISYICSRYYRAPELVFGAKTYTTSVDIWSAGCVLAELFLSRPIFPGASGIDQLVEIIKVMGTPTMKQVQEMNPNYSEFSFPEIESRSWSRVFRQRAPEDGINLVSLLLDYTPGARIPATEACAHKFFDEVKDSNV